MSQHTSGRGSGGSRRNVPRGDARVRGPADPAAEPVAEDVAEPVAEPVTEPVTDSTAEPVMDPATDAGETEARTAPPVPGDPRSVDAPPATTEPPSEAERAAAGPGPVPTVEAADVPETEQMPEQMPAGERGSTGSAGWPGGSRVGDSVDDEDLVAADQEDSAGYDSAGLRRFESDDEQDRSASEWAGGRPGSHAAPGTGDVPADPDADPGEAAWRDLQIRFVDDPQAAVAEAGTMVQNALNDLRERVGSGSTEDLRTTFRRYRELHRSLR